MNDLRKTNEEFIEIVASGLHYLDRADELDINKCTSKELLDMHNG